MLLDPNRLDAHDVRVVDAPFAFLIAPDQLAASDRERLLGDFPRFGSAGFFPYQAEECGDAVRSLVAELVAPGFAAAIGRRLGIDALDTFPTLVTLSDAVNLRHGTIHTDSRSKIATALLYLNARWPDTSAGCLRFLARGDDIDALAAPEIRPLYGTLVAFRRAANSWHGHLPFEGERRVIQVAWLTSGDELRRKHRRGRFSRWVKRIIGALDRRWGARRSASARHD